MPQSFPSTYVDETGATVRFPNPTKGISESVKSNTLIVKFDSNSEQRRPKSPAYRQFDLSWAYLPEMAYQALLNFYFVHTNAKAFYWVHPFYPTNTYLVRFDNDVLSAEDVLMNNKTNHYKISIKLVQVLS